jgi:hypothetical protein
MQTRSKNRYSRVSPLRQSLNSSSTSINSNNSSSQTSEDTDATLKVLTRGPQTARRGRSSRSRSRSKGRTAITAKDKAKVYTRKELNDELMSSNKEEQECIVIDDDNSSLKSESKSSKLNSRRNTHDSQRAITPANDDISVEGLLKEIDTLTSPEKVKNIFTTLSDDTNTQIEENQIKKRESPFVNKSKENSLVRSSTPEITLTKRASVEKQQLATKNPSTQLPPIQEDIYYHSGYLRYSVKTICLIAFVTFLVIFLLFVIDNKLPFIQSFNDNLKNIFSNLYENFVFVYKEVMDKL